MTFPTVHLNGTSADDLLQELRTASDGVQFAVNAVCESCPNARDYYPQVSDAYNKARAEYSARLDKLREIRDELLEITENVYQQKQQRARR